MAFGCQDLEAWRILHTEWRVLQIVILQHVLPLTHVQSQSLLRYQ
jgi:hypothetical protein